MKYDPNLHHRHSIRLKDYDYSQPGAYFITTNTLRRDPLFGAISEGEMHLSPAGKILQKVWLDLPRRYPNVCLDTICIMPDHVHMILWLVQIEKGEKSPSISEAIRALKSYSAKQINMLLHTPGSPVWQRNYYERIIRNDDELQRLRTYILENPQSWEEDR